MQNVDNDIEMTSMELGFRNLLAATVDPAEHANLLVLRAFIPIAPDT